MRHEACCEGGKAEHNVDIDPDSRLGRILQESTLRVNSYHHQGLLAEDVAPGLRPVAVACDGIVEAFEGTGNSWLVAVQWHPERETDEDVHRACLPLFEEFVRAAQQTEKSIDRLRCITGAPR